MDSLAPALTPTLSLVFGQQAILDYQSYGSATDDENLIRCDAIDDEY